MDEEEEEPRKINCIVDAGGDEDINSRFVTEISLNIVLVPVFEYLIYKPIYEHYFSKFIKSEIS